jgi:hypothetical protein
MKKIGLTLITLAFLAGAYVSVLDDTDVNWTFLGLALVVGFAGVALARLGVRSAATASHVLASNMAAVRESLDNIVREVGRLCAEKEAIGTYEMGREIDETVLDHLNRFVDAREAISHTLGLQAYADVMSHYAGGERYLNRVWSASADGYVDEVAAYLDYARDQFGLARDKLAALGDGATGGKEPARRSW